MRVLVACEFSGIVRDAFAARGHDAWSCDLLPSERPGQHIQADFRSVVQDSWDMVGYHYECRVMANSGVRWLHERPQRWQELDEACAMFNLTLRDPRPGWSENPVQHRHARERIDRRHDQTIQPFQFGHPESKRTCLWLRGLPPLMPTLVLPTPANGKWDNQTPSGQNKHGPFADRWKIRSRTYKGIAAAMADQWGQQD